MEGSTLRDLRKPILFITLIALGIVFALVAHAFMNMQGEAVLLGFLLFPLLAYALIFGALQEFGFGGVTAKFNTAISRALSIDFGSIQPSIADLTVVGEKGFSAIEDMIKRYKLKGPKPIVMVMMLGASHKYPRADTSAFIKHLSTYPNFRFVVFIDDHKKFQACIEPWAIERLLETPGAGDEFMAAINNAAPASDLIQYASVKTTTARSHEKSVDALRKMTEHSLTALVVVDDKNQLCGVVDREQLVSVMVLMLGQK